MQHVFQVTPAFTDLVHSTPSCIGFHPVLDGREREPVVKQVVQRARRRASLRRAAGCDKGAQGQLRQGRAGWHGRGWEPAVQRARASLRAPGLHLRERPVALGRRSDNVPLRRMEPLRRLRRRGGEGGDAEDRQPLQRECVPHRPNRPSTSLSRVATRSTSAMAQRSCRLAPSTQTKGANSECCVSSPEVAKAPNCRHSFLLTDFPTCSGRLPCAIPSMDPTQRHLLDAHGRY